MQVRPHESMKEHYEWRFGLKEGDEVDYFNENYSWANGKIAEVKKESVMSEAGEMKEETFEIRIEGEDRWLSITDSKIQRVNSIVQPGVTNKYSSDIFVDDYNDILFDPGMTCCFIARPEATKSQMFIDLLTYAHKELHLFDTLAQTLKKKEMKI